MVGVINGKGYDALVDAYGEDIVEPGCEIMVEIKKRRRFFAKPSWSGGIMFDKKGILYKVHHESGGRKTSLERLSVGELSRIGVWGFAEVRA